MVATRALAAASLMLGCLAAPDTWLQGGTGTEKMCAGVKTTCDSVQSCTYTAYGPCGGSASPDVYVEAQVEGMAAVSGDTAYLTDSTKLEVISADTVANNGYRRMNAAETFESAEYASITSGAYMGSDTAGGYVGMAAYLMKNGTIETSKNKFFVGDYGATTMRDYDICITEAPACTAKNTYSAGEYKFSIFGYTRGTGYETAYDSWSGVTHFGVRTKMSIVGASADEFTVTCNGGTALASIGSTDVTKVTMSFTSGRTMDIDFPTKYNQGVVVDGTGPAAPTVTKDVKIKVSQVSGETAIYVDYLFEVITVANKYFVYDPAIKDKGAGGAPAAATSGACSTVWHSFLLLLALDVVGMLQR